MLALGISKEAVRDAIWLIDKYAVFTNQAKSYGFKNVVQHDFLTWETDMKFDVVVGNPPYQSNAAKKDKLWFAFLEKAISLSDNYVSFITPDVWTSGETKVGKLARKLISTRGLDYLDFTANKWFSVGESICAFQLSTNRRQETTVIGLCETSSSLQFTGQLIHKTKNDEFAYNLCQKIKTGRVTIKSMLTRFEHRRPESMAHYQLERTSKFCNKVYYSSTETWYTDLDTSAYRGPKVVFNNSGYYFSPAEPNRYMWADDSSVALGNAFQLMLETKAESEFALTVFRSKLYRFLVQTSKSGGFNATALYSLPKIDFTRSWTDAELYAYFGLTQEEADYIEATVK